MSDLELFLEQVRDALADRPLVVLAVTFASMWLFARIGAWLARRG